MTWSPCKIKMLFAIALLTKCQMDKKNSNKNEIYVLTNLG
jgi:hypothetical protein